MRIVDTHQHLWDLDRFRYTWVSSQPRLNRSFLMQDYLTATAGLDVAQSVHVEADVDEPYMLDETRYVLALADEPTNPLQGVVACARPEHKDFRGYIEKIAGHPKLKGIRRILHTQPDALGQDVTFRDNVRALSQYDLSFDICVLERQLPIAVKLVALCPDVSFILDHCGVPQLKEKRLDPWRAQIAEIAGYPNLACKISGVVAHADPQNWTADDLKPYVEHVIECFGWDRIMFGSDWPVCTLSASYKQWVEALRSIIHSAGAENIKKLFHDNAIRAYRLNCGSKPASTMSE